MLGAPSVRLLCDLENVCPAMFSFPVRWIPLGFSLVRPLQAYVLSTFSPDWGTSLKAVASSGGGVWLAEVGHCGWIFEGNSLAGSGS